MDSIIFFELAATSGTYRWPVDESNYLWPVNYLAFGTSVEVFDKAKRFRLESAFAKERRLARW